MTLMERAMAKLGTERGRWNLFVRIVSGDTGYTV